MFDYALQSIFAGAWGFIFHWGLGIGLIVVFVLAAVFSPVFKKDFVYCAVIVGVFMIAMGIGVRDEANRTAAQEQLVTKKVETVVNKTKTPAAQKAKDKYDSPNY